MPDAMPDPCCDGQPALLDVEDALAALLEHARAVSDTEQTGLMQATGRVLAQDLRSPIDVPGFDNSAMDGYALHSRDIALAQTEGLTITQRIPAGGIAHPLAPGSAARIFTGAPVPEGADTVVMQESCREQDNRVMLEQPVTAGANIRPRGNDIRAGQTILHGGTLLQAAQLGLAASVGFQHAEVYRRLKVAIFSSGDELIEPGQPLAPGQIYNSNLYQLNALLDAQGCEVINLGTVADDFERTRRTLLTAADQADLVITSGGVSVGEEDHIKAALESVGELTLWRIRMKPGKPLAFGHIGKVPFIGLPGNPVSVFVTFMVIARPYLHRLQSRADTGPVFFPVRAGFDYRCGYRREYVRARLHQEAGHGLSAEIYPKQGSDVLSSVTWADGLVEITAESKVCTGDPVRFLPFPEWAK